MKTHKKEIIASLILGVLLLVGVFVVKNSALGVRSVEEPTVTTNTFRYFNFFASSTVQTNYGTTTSATSTNITPYFDSKGNRDDGSFMVAGAKKVTMYFKRGDTVGTGNTGTSTFFVQGTPDGTNWYYINKFLQATSTTVLSDFSIIAATSTVRLGLQLDYDALLKIRCIVAESTDGEHSCAAAAEF